MEKFIGTKIVQAEHALRCWMPDGTKVIIPCTDEKIREGTTDAMCEAGYRVVYEDGYESWSPREVFEKSYRPADGLTFGLAIEAAKMGRRIARKGWNGKGQYVELGTEFTYKTAEGDLNHLCYHEDIDSKALVFVGTRGRQVGWLASQADMLAEDWYIVD